MVILALATLALAQGGGILGAPSPEIPEVRWVQGGPLRLADLRGAALVKLLAEP